MPKTVCKKKEPLYNCSLPKLKNKIPCKFNGISWKNRQKILLNLIEQEKDGGNLYQHHQKDIA